VGGLSFLAPLYLLGILAVAVPIALHLFRRRTDTIVEFPAVRLLSTTPVEQQRRRRLRELILLALRVTALVLLAGAFARPYLAGQRLAADTPLTIVAVDRSFSLSAPGVFDRARAMAAEAVNEAPSGHAVALVAFDETADTIVDATTDRGAVTAAIRALTPGISGTRYAAAITRAADVLGPRAGRVVVVTDLQQAGWHGPPRGGLAEDVEVSVKQVEASLQNLAVVSAERRGGRVEATLRNFGLELRTAQVTLAIEGAEAARATISIPAQSAAPVGFDVEAPPRGAAAITVADQGGVPVDDTRYVVLDPAEPTRVLVLVADPSALGGGLYVERALGAADASQAFAVTVIDGRSLSSWTPDQISREHALMLLGTRTLERRGRELVSGYFSRGGSALLALGPDIDPATLNELMGMSPAVAPDAQALGGGATLVLADTRHPVLRPFAMPAAALGDVMFERYWPVGDEGRRVLARFSGGPAALIEQPRPNGRLLIFASDLDNKWNRFPLSPAFVPFVVETGRYLTEIQRQPQTWVLPAAPAGVDARPGVHLLPGSGGASGRRVAVNVNMEESNPAPISQDEFLAAVPRVARTAQPDETAEARKAEDDQRFWQWGLLVMFLALAGEGLVGRRAT
jgi:Aerotolerance regulator N-terminal/von Willebrand factor type A domain